MPQRKSGLKLHKSTGQWYETINGKRVYLGTDHSKARKRLADLRSDEKRQEQDPHDCWLDRPIVDLVDEFLDHKQKQCKPGTYANYARNLKRVLEIIKPELLVGDVKRINASQVSKTITGTMGQNSVRDTLETFKGLFSWAVENDLLEHSPLQKYRIPPRIFRSRVMTPREFRLLLRHAEKPFRWFLFAARVTGCRPGELRGLRWEHVDLERELLVIPDHKTVTQQEQPRPRIIPLPPSLVRRIKVLLASRRNDQRYVFLNLRRQPWTKNAVVIAMRRARRRAGLESESGEQLVAYTSRHTFGTEGSGKVSDIELAELMGHTSTSTTRRYVHLSAERLKGIRNRVG